MARQKKKRNKAYKGDDAKNAPANVVRVAAVDRNKFAQWWFEKKRILKPIIITILVITIIVWLLFELLRVVFS
ncbi:hypothetical protein KC952_04095 [Candidatus Saccharibacteria bacterium]|jgi:hypothetical protein|nr:hypothetical protein [Candidatus Saccharibacteria bacterium]